MANVWYLLAAVHRGRCFPQFLLGAIESASGQHRPFVRFAPHEYLETFVESGATCY